MSKIKDLFISSYNEIKTVRCITLIAMFGAISIVLGYLTIMPVDTIKITFTFLPNEFVYYLFGPVVGVIYGAALDILTWFIRPTGPFFYGFTVSAVLTGLLYGSILYKRPISVKRILIANLIHLCTINLLLNTFWLTQLYGYSFMALLPMRALKAAIMFPVETAMLFAVIKGVEATGVLKGFQKKTRIS